jgi:hypothetical protein
MDVYPTKKGFDQQTTGEFINRKDVWGFRDKDILA